MSIEYVQLQLAFQLKLNVGHNECTNCNSWRTVKLTRLTIEHLNLNVRIIL